MRDDVLSTEDIEVSATSLYQVEVPPGKSAIDLTGATDTKDATKHFTGFDGSGVWLVACRACRLWLACWSSSSCVLRRATCSIVSRVTAFPAGGVWAVDRCQQRIEVDERIS